MGAIDADGYVVYSSQQSGVSTAVDVGNVTQYMVRELIAGNTYSISVRAYQDLLGQASNAISEAFEGMETVIIPAVCMYFMFNSLSSGVPATELVNAVRSY